MKKRKDEAGILTDEEWVTLKASKLEGDTPRTYGMAYWNPRSMRRKCKKFPNASKRKMPKPKKVRQ